MANTKTSKVLTVGRHTAVYFTLQSDGTQETNTIIYDSSVIAGLLGIADPLTSTIDLINVSSSSAVGVARLNWDATTPVTAWAIPYQAGDGTYCFRKFGGIKNLGGAGVTGDITLTTTGLAAGDSLTLVLVVRPD